MEMRLDFVYVHITHMLDIISHQDELLISRNLEPHGLQILKQNPKKNTKQIKLYHTHL